MYPLPSVYSDHNQDPPPQQITGLFQPLLLGKFHKSPFHLWPELTKEQKGFWIWILSFVIQKASESPQNCKHILPTKQCTQFEAMHAEGMGTLLMYVLSLLSPKEKGKTFNHLQTTLIRVQVQWEPIPFGTNKKACYVLHMMWTIQKKLANFPFFGTCF
jgi:hypothetical protein